MPKNTNPFWKSVLVAGADLSKSINYALPTKISLFPVCHNPLFKIGNTTIKSASFGENKKIQVADFLAENSTDFCTVDNFNDRMNLGLRQPFFEKIKQSILDGANKLGISLGPKSIPHQDNLFLATLQLVRTKDVGLSIKYSDAKMMKKYITQ